MEQKSISIEFVKNKILEQKVLVKSIRSSANDFKHWLYLINQLKYPEFYRPVKPLSNEIDQNYLYNAQTQTWQHRDVSKKKRGEPKNTSFTKKTSTSLLPPNGNMHLFRHGIGEHIGLMFDIDLCKIKDNYIFDRNINSDKKPWLAKKDIQPGHNMPLTNSTSLFHLRQQGRDTKEILPHNELLASLSKAGVLGVFCGENNLTHRVGARALQTFVAQTLKINVPIFIIHPQFGITQYTQEQQHKDLQVALSLGLNHPARQYANVYYDFLEEKQKKFFVSSQASNQAILPALPGDLKKYITSFFRQNEKERFSHWLNNKNMLRSMRDLPTPVQQVLQANTEIPRTRQIPTLNKQEISEKKHYIQSAITSSNYYIKNQIAVNKAIEMLCESDIQIAIELFFDCLKHEQHLSPLLRHFISQGILSKLHYSQCNQFACDMIRFSDKDNFSFIDEISFNLKDFYEEIVVSQDITRASSEESRYDKTKVASQTLNLMTLAALYNPQLCAPLHKREPLLILDALKAINNLYDLINKYQNNKNYYWEEKSNMSAIYTSPINRTMLEDAHLQLLLLVDVNNVAYHFNKHEKRLLEKHYLETMSDPHHIEKIMQLPSTRSHRHEIHDAFCRFFLGTHKETTMQKNLRQAFQRNARLT